LERQLDGIRMRKQRLAILFPDQGSAALQLFERDALGGKCKSEGRTGGHPRILYPWVRL
jgi:hypothetical protein